ncbi:hypothetical protein PR048_011909, partial [Dryococelus australis]
MWFYNLGIHIIAKDVDKTVFFTWTEDQGGRGSNEIFSILRRIIEVDYIVQKGVFKIIDHKFTKICHSYLDSDRDFGRIEKRLRKYQTICTPEKYSQVIASSSRKGSSTRNIISEILKTFQK